MIDENALEWKTPNSNDEIIQAAERERIIARCTVEMKDEFLMDAYDEGYNDGLAKAIEIVKGGEDA